MAGLADRKDSHISRYSGSFSLSPSPVSPGGHRGGGGLSLPEDRTDHGVEIRKKLCRQSMRFFTKDDTAIGRLSDGEAVNRGTMSDTPTMIGGAHTAELDWESVVAQYEGALLRYTARFLNDSAAAEDVVQEVFIRLYHRWTPALPNDGRLRQWLYRTAHNAAVDHIRAEQRRRRLHDEAALERETVAPASVQAEMEASDRRRVVIERLGDLEPSEREVLILRLQEGLSYDEIARITGRRLGTVGCLIHTATRKLTASLRRDGVL